MSHFMINGIDFSGYVKGLKIGYETLVSDGSGRNAAGDTVLDIINRKVKIYVTFRPMDDSEMVRLLNAIKDYVVTVSYRDSRTNDLQRATCYTGTPEPEYYWVLNGKGLYKELNLNFIEL